MGIGTADTSRLPKWRNCKDNSNLLQNNPARQKDRNTSGPIEATKIQIKYFVAAYI